MAESNVRILCKFAFVALRHISRLVPTIMCIYIVECSTDPIVTLCEIELLCRIDKASARSLRKYCAQTYLVAGFEINSIIYERRYFDPIRLLLTMPVLIQYLLFYCFA